MMLKEHDVWWGDLGTEGSPARGAREHLRATLSRMQRPALV